MFAKLLSSVGIVIPVPPTREVLPPENCGLYKLSIVDTMSKPEIYYSFFGDAVPTKAEIPKHFDKPHFIPCNFLVLFVKYEEECWAYVFSGSYGLTLVKVSYVIDLLKVQMKKILRAVVIANANAKEMEHKTLIRHGIRVDVLRTFFGPVQFLYDVICGYDGEIARKSFFGDLPKAKAYLELVMATRRGYLSFADMMNSSCHVMSITYNSSSNHLVKTMYK